jgi:hypothetical protein
VSGAREQAPRRRGSDVVVVEQLTAHQLYRRYLIVGSWIGHVLFVVNGSYIAFSYGGFGGIQFFSHMWLLDRASNYAALFGMLAGIFIAAICVWALGVILCAIIASLVYWFRYRSIPVAVE